MKLIELVKGTKTPKFKIAEKNFIKDISTVEDCAIVLDDDVILIDFDDRKDIAEALLKKYKFKAVKTMRGYHFYFKIDEKLKNYGVKNSIKVINALGCLVDIKTGYGGKKSIGVIKQNGGARTFLNCDLDSLLVDLPPLPLFLYPLKKNDNISIVDSEQGERNSNLFNHLTRVIYSGLPIENKTDFITELAFFINDFFKRPMDTIEVKNIVKSVINYYDENPSLKKNDFFNEILENSKNDKNKINLFKLADFLTEKLKTVLYERELFFKIDENYTSDDLTFRRYLLNDLKIEILQKQENDLIHELKKRAKIVDLDNMAIKLNNGYFLENGEIKVIDEGDPFTIFKIDVDYNPNSYDETVNNFLKWFSCGNNELSKILIQILGHCFLTKNSPHFAFFFTASSGRNGKSTFLKMVQNLFNPYVSFLSFQDLEDVKNLHQLKNKLVNIGDDLNINGVIKDVSNFKKLVSGEIVQERALYTNATPFQPMATLLFSANELPKISDVSGGISRRLVVFPCFNQININDIDINLDSKLSSNQAKSYLLNLALKGIKLIKANNNNILLPKKVLEKTNQYLVLNNNILSFLEDYKDIERLPRFELYKSYIKYCFEINDKPYKQSIFYQELRGAGFKDYKSNGVRYFEKLKKD